MKKDTPIIVRKRKKHKHAHHGGTWKIAYADFMTAMMAFFLVMWLLSQSDPTQREQIADYFRVPLKPALAQGNKTSLSDSVIPGGGDDLVKKDGEVFKKQMDAVSRQQALESLRQAKKKLQQMIQTDPRLNNFKSNILLTLTNDGLLIQITDSQNRPMFKIGSEIPESYMNGILQALVPLLNELPNKISLTGHTDSLPYSGGVGGYSNWELSTGRANAVRRVLVSAGLSDERFLRVIGNASHLPLEDVAPDDPRNRRISILVLSRSKEQAIRSETRSVQPVSEVPEMAEINGAQLKEVQGYTDGRE
ncbi:flagellar motor protein MotB [Pantoea sp. BRR-3P]|uniref:flagellar motor protein MotB n=1 Tax=Pantoea sp. BRR-3P TaxID=3141541 RepID=UPI000EE02E48|nr:motility protein MotB [Pantoea sp.]